MSHSKLKLKYYKKKFKQTKIKNKSFLSNLIIC